MTEMRRGNRVPRDEWHRITNTNVSEGIGDCSKCGPGVRVRVTRPGKSDECWTRHLAHRQSWKERRPSSPDELRRYWIRYTHGLTDEEIAELRARAQGGCEICGQDVTGRRENIDHCHTSGRVRGILCTRCNVGLGLFIDDPARLRSAIRYLERPAAP